MIIIIAKYMIFKRSILSSVIIMHVLRKQKNITRVKIFYLINKIYTIKIDVHIKVKFTVAFCE